MEKPPEAAAKAETEVRGDAFVIDVRGLVHKNVCLDGWEQGKYSPRRLVHCLNV